MADSAAEGCFPRESQSNPAHLGTAFSLLDRNLLSLPPSMQSAHTVHGIMSVPDKLSWANAEILHTLSRGVGRMEVSVGYLLKQFV